MDAVTAWLTWLQIAAIFGSGALNVFLFLRAARKDRVDKVDEAIGELQDVDQEFDVRLTRVEERMQSMPKHSDLVEIRRELGKLAEAVAASNERGAGVLAAVQSLQRFLMERHG